MFLKCYVAIPTDSDFRAFLCLFTSNASTNFVSKAKKKSIGVVVVARIQCVYFKKKNTHNPVYCWGKTTRNLYSFKKDDCLFFIHQQFLPPLRLSREGGMENGLAFHHARKILSPAIASCFTLLFCFKESPTEWDNKRKWLKRVRAFFSHHLCTWR